MRGRIRRGTRASMACGVIGSRAGSVAICVWLLVGALASGSASLRAAEEPSSTAPLSLQEVLESVTSRYPPLLAALIEQDVVSGRLRQAEGAFDTNVNANLSGAAAGYYDGNGGYAFLEQALQSWGAKVYGGYRLSSGFLPNYNTQRTPTDGQITAGVRLSLLRDGRIDRSRASLAQARIDQALADPFILRQRIDFVRAATISYYGWVSAGFRLRAAEQLLRVANERDVALAEQVRRGAVAPIVRTDNERLVISRQLAVVQAQRRLEAATIELSLFLRDGQDRPVLAPRSRLPADFPPLSKIDPGALSRDLEQAYALRPELQAIALSIQKLEIENSLARNDMLPNLDVALEARQSPTGRRLDDIEAFEAKAAVELRVPLQRRDAKGRVQVSESQIRRLRTDMQFARDRIAADVRDAYSALGAAVLQAAQARRNVELAVLLEDAERLRFQQGATDLLALQIREQATFDARLGEVDAIAEYFRALAVYRAAIGSDAVPVSR